jgi:hypothetical protein
MSQAVFMPREGRRPQLRGKRFRMNHFIRRRGLPIGRTSSPARAGLPARSWESPRPHAAPNGFGDFALPLRPDSESAAAQEPPATLTTEIARVGLHPFFVAEETLKLHPSLMICALFPQAQIARIGLHLFFVIEGTLNLHPSLMICALFPQAQFFTS